MFKLTFDFKHRDKLEFRGKMALRQKSRANDVQSWIRYYKSINHYRKRICSKRNLDSYFNFQVSRNALQLSKTG